MMIGNILTLFIFFVISDCTVDNQGILLQISSGDNVCNNDKLFKNFKFSDTPEFAAMCNIPVPNKSQVKFLLENNVIPILCMGVYDVSLKLCREAMNDTIYFKDLFPPSSEQFTGIFNTLKQSEEYSDLNKFCSETVIKQNNIESVNNNTKFWWEVLNNKLHSNESCKSICRTNVIHQVHPLCSFIAWSNDIVHNHHTSLEESEAKVNFEVPVDNLTNKNVLKSETMKKVEEHDELPEISNDEIQKSLTSALKTTDLASGSINLSHLEQLSPFEPEYSNVGLNSTKQSIVGNPGKSNSPIIVNEKKDKTTPPIESAKSAVNTSSDTSNNGFVIQRPENIEDKQNEKDTSIFPAEEINSNSVGKAASVDSKINVKNNDKVIKPFEVSEDTDQNTFNEEINLDSVPSDQPVGSDPEIQQQFEEELEDEATVGDNLEKTVSKKKGDNLNKHTPLNDQGKHDEAHNDMDRTTILLEDPFIEAEDTHFFSYFLFMSLLTIVAYLAFHNKNKLLALAMEGRRTKSSRRRPNSSNYSKLDCSLEEAMASNTTASVTHVLY